MGDTQRAIALINEAGESDSDIVELSNLGLTTQDLEQLIPELAQLPKLTQLHLDENALTTLPENINMLPNLEELNLVENQIDHLPDELSALENLQILEVGNNQLQTFPAVIFGLTKLKSLFLSHNQFETIPNEFSALSKLRLVDLEHNMLRVLPESIGSLPYLVQMDLQANPLSSETMAWLDQTYTQEQVLYNMAAFEINNTTEEVLNQLYGADAGGVLNTLRDTVQELAPIRNGSNKAILPATAFNEFLAILPTDDPLWEQVYLPAAHRLLSNALHPQGDRQTALQIIGTSLGDCATPISALLMQEHVHHCVANGGELSPSNEVLLEREALEEHITAAFSDTLQPNERIEQVQGLLNTVYLEGAENNVDNPIRITGDRQRLPSKTAHQDFAFQQLQGHTRAELVDTFTQLVCTTNEHGQTRNEAGTYALDPLKMSMIREPYMAKLGLVTNVEKHINKVEEEMRGVLAQHSDLFSTYYDNPKAQGLINIDTQLNVLRKGLYQASDKEAHEGICQGFLMQYRESCQNTLAELNRENLAGMGVAGNEHQRHQRPPSPGGKGPKRTRSGVQEQKSQGRGI